MDFTCIADTVANPMLFDPSSEHAALRAMVRSFANQELLPRARECDEMEQFNEQLFRSLGKNLNLFGITVPSPYGGAGMDALASTLVVEELSAVDPGFALSYLAHEVLFVHNFFHSSSEEQRTRFLSRVLDGTWIAGIALTEPGSGTDVLGMSTHAEPHADHYILNGVKQFITNAPQADVFFVYAKTERTSKRITALLITRDLKGVSIGKPEAKMGMRSSPTAQVVFENVIVPRENLLGEEGNGLVHMMRNLEIERVTLAAQSLGIARTCLANGARYAIQDRKQFGQPLSVFGQIQRMLAEGFAEYQAARALVYSVASQISPNQRRSLGAASAKLVASRMAEKVAREMLQILGGYGYTREYPVERFLRDSILLSIGGGTNEAMQKNITRDLAICLKD
ncbi:MAG: acyl-CoA dehydrogenase family protein [Acidobacteriota bacterium]|jgi:isovaleryl-CoA dehydrogenase